MESHNSNHWTAPNFHTRLLKKNCSNSFAEDHHQRMTIKYHKPTTDFEQIQTRNREWIGHTLRKPEATIEKDVLDWNYQGTRKGECPKTIWRKILLKEAKAIGKTWKPSRRLEKTLFLSCVPQCTTWIDEVDEGKRKHLLSVMQIIQNCSAYWCLCK